jgi:hypothetical protein
MIITKSESALRFKRMQSGEKGIFQKFRIFAPEIIEKSAIVGD